MTYQPQTAHDLKFGLFAMDPGTTTGIAYTKKPIRYGFKPADAFDQAGLEVTQIDCSDEMNGAVEIAGLWEYCINQWSLKNVKSKNMIFVYEDFILRAGPHSSARSGLSPVRVTALVQGLLYHARPRYAAQQPGDAKSRWTNERLKRAGLWTVGMEHGRDATRHIALFYARHLVDSKFRK